MSEMFIKLHDMDNDPVLINVEDIISVETSQSGKESIVTYGRIDYSMRFKESVNDIAKYLSRCVTVINLN